MPVRELSVRTTLDGENVSGATGAAGIYVDRGNTACSFVRWNEQAWPPVDDDAERLAEVLCEVFGPNWYESFLAIIKARDEAARLRILRRARAPIDLEEYRRRLDGVSEILTRSVDLPSPKTAGAPPIAPLSVVLAATADTSEDDTPLHPLWRVESLLVLGQLVQVSAEVGDSTDGLDGVREHEGSGGASRGRAGIRTDLVSCVNYKAARLIVAAQQVHV